MTTKQNIRQPIANALALILTEYTRAARLHKPYSSAHEGWSVIFEEVDELWDEVKLRDRNMADMRAEAVQVASTALRFLIDVCGVK